MIGDRWIIALTVVAIVAELAAAVVAMVLLR